ncbi:MAG: ROK family protein [Acidobacteriota bacterium]|nr:ROK family protein [Acidobacteriota bacterium]
MREPASRQSTRGRLIGAVDIGGSKIAVGLVREDGQLLGRRTCATLPERGFDDTMQRIIQMLEELGADIGEVDGIGVGCPGPLDPVSGTVLEVGTLPGWSGANLIAPLQAHFGVDVVVENDADAATLGEYVWGSGAGCSRFLYVTISTGIGGGAVFDGRLYRGAHGAHPEFGHHVIDPRGPLCYCGAHGCWESLVSGTAMAAWLQQQYPALGALSAQQICDRAAQGDPVALSAMQRQGYYVGVGLANLITLFAPELIALGGGVMWSGELFLEEARRVITAICTQVPAARTRIVHALAGSDVGLLGAAQCWLQRFG